jgi:hypothetical protein
MSPVHILAAFMVAAVAGLPLCLDTPVTLDSGFCLCEDSVRLPRCQQWARECGAGVPSANSPVGFCVCPGTLSADATQLNCQTPPHSSSGEVAFPNRTEIQPTDFQKIADRRAHVANALDVASVLAFGLGIAFSISTMVA